MSDKKKVVIKVGTSTLTYDTGEINLRRIELLSQVICDLNHSGCEVVLVSSGAIAVGVSKMGFDKRPDLVCEKQAVSAVGQRELMGLYGKFFGEYGCSVAQILITKNVLEDETRRKNAVNAFRTLLEWGVVPIVNENDVISTAEIEFGDNDTLSSVVAELIDADALIILSDIDGLFDKDPAKYPDAKLISEVDEITDELMKSAGGAGTNRGTGGMVTKLIAAKHARDVGVEMWIINGRNPKAIYDVLEGKQVGTKFKLK
ncbi:MAG: glutamate 5-kinase [Clostridia bacterium]|nr:glutamate 5-kinase [Clostridia bacterium]